MNIYACDEDVFNELRRIANSLGSGEKMDDNRRRDISNRMHVLLSEFVIETVKDKS